jgi:hypothetical protein
MNLSSGARDPRSKIDRRTANLSKIKKGNPAMEAKKPRKITPEEVEEIRHRFSEQMDQMVENLNRGALAAAETINENKELPPSET